MTFLLNNVLKLDSILLGFWELFWYPLQIAMQIILPTHFIYLTHPSGLITGKVLFRKGNNVAHYQVGLLSACEEGGGSLQ